MLTNIHIKNLALIDETDIELDKGLTVLTGETGAGKSVILGSIATGLGLRTPGEMLRENGEDALVILSFYFDDKAILDKINKMGVDDIENGEIIIMRKIHSGRSSFKINGINVSASQIKELAPFLLDLHAQRDNLLLLKEEEQLKLVDTFCDEEFTEILSETREVYKKYKKIKNQLKETDIDEEEINKELDLLTHEINELSAAALKKGEYEELESRFERSQNAMKINESLSGALGSLSYDPENVSDQMGKAISAIRSVSQYDTKLKNIEDAISNADSVITDVINDLNEYISKMDADPGEFSDISERLDTYNRLRHKYSTDTEGLQKLLEEKEARKRALEDHEGVLERLRDEFSHIKQELSLLYNKLHDKRSKSAAILSEKIKTAAKDLNFNTVEFEIDVQKGKISSESGLDKVCFMFSANPGEKIKPLKDVASGGELSRMMLAIKTVTTGKSGTETLIFDEIDTGISGRTAQKVGEKMAQISKDRQIICITHLPQIAALADSHFLINKSAETGRSITDIKELNENDSVSELSRMLGGSEITESVLANAREMKSLATQYKHDKRK